MAFTHGKDAKVFVSGYDMTSYLHSAGAQMNADLAETSTFGAIYKSFVAGLLDSKMNFEGYYDGSTGAIDAVFASLQGQDVYLVFLPAGDAVGARGRAMYGVEITYEISAGIDGPSAVTMEAQSKTGAEPVLSNSIKADRTTTGSDANPGVDSGIVGGTTNGWSAFLQVFTGSGSGATLDVRLQDSADGSAFLDVAGAAFTQVLVASPINAQRITGTGTLRRYTKFAWTIAGSSPHWTFWAGHVRK